MAAVLGALLSTSGLPLMSQVFLNACVSFFSMDLYLLLVLLLLVCFVVSIFSRGFWTELLRSNAQNQPFHFCPNAVPCWSPLIPAFYHFISALPGSTHIHYFINAWFNVNTVHTQTRWWLVLMVGSHNSLISPPFPCRHTHTYTQNKCSALR